MRKRFTVGAHARDRLAGLRDLRLGFLGEDIPRRSERERQGRGDDGQLERMGRGEGRG